MYCTKCGVALREGDHFCAHCGSPIGVGKAVGAYPALMLDKANKKVGGVCAGFARYLGADVTLVRVICLMIAVCTGFGFLAYVVAWIAMPSDNRYYAGAPAITARPSPTC